MYADYHTHTSFSDDSAYPMENCVVDGIELGLEEICFTEHMDYGVKTVENCDCESYYEEVLRMRSLYGDRIAIKMGMEFGVQRHTISDYQKVYDAYPFDFILMSCHQVDDLEFWNNAYQAGKSQRAYDEAYYEEILHCAQSFDDFSVLAHLDMIKRYDKKGAYPFEKVKDIVAEIYRTVIQKGKGIEINTSSERYRLPDSTPSREFLELYKDMGGKIITIGSDSHAKAHLGHGIEDAKAFMKGLGFEAFYTYDQMEPVAWRLG